MFKIGEIRELIRLIDETSVSELKVESEGMKLHIKKNDPVVSTAIPVQVPSPWTQAGVWGGPAPVAQSVTHAIAQGQLPETVATIGTENKTVVSAATEEEAALHIIMSPMVGTFYRAPSPDSPSFLEVGSKVTEKSVVCIVEAMKLMNEIEAEVRGEVIEVLAENGQLVEYGQPLFRIKLS